MLLRRALRWASLALAMAGCALLALPLASIAQRASGAIDARRLWAGALRSDRPEPTAGEPALWLSIPAVSIETPVLHGADAARLRRFPARLDFGCAGATFRLVAILGHRDTHFRRLEHFGPGGEIVTIDRRERRSYWRVTRREILAPADAERAVLDATQSRRLVLITCHPFRFIGPAPKRILFWAEPAPGPQSAQPRRRS